MPARIIVSRRITYGIVNGQGDRPKLATNSLYAEVTNKAVWNVSRAMTVATCTDERLALQIRWNEQAILQALTMILIHSLSLDTCIS